LVPWVGAAVMIGSLRDICEMWKFVFLRPFKYMAVAPGRLFKVDGLFTKKAL
jgi:hypothetical protein